MKVIPIKGTIVSNNDSWIYDWFGWDYTAPKNVALPETGEDIEVHVNSGGGDVYAGSEIYTALRSYSGLLRSWALLQAQRALSQWLVIS